MPEPTEAPPATPEPGPLRHGRALFVALHLFAITFMALPSVGGGMSRSAWGTPTVQAEFQLWTARLNGWGVDVTAEQLEDTLWEVAVAYEDGRRMILEPMYPYFRYTGSWQSWRMFVAPHRYPGRLEIELDSGEGWQPVYVARSGEHDWMRRLLDHDRCRASIFRYAWSHFRRGRKEFTDWVAVQAARDFPEARRVRTSFVRYRTRSPEEVRAGTPAREERELKNVRNLRDYR